MKHFIFLLKREFKLFLGNKTMRSVFFMAPIVYALIIGFTYQKGKVTDIPVIVVNQDKTPMSQQLIDMLEDNKSMNVLLYDQEPLNLKDEVIKKEAAAVVIIPDRFESMMLLKKYPEVNVYVNTANVLTANFSTKALQTTIGTFAAGAEIKALQKKGLSSDAAATQYEPFKTNYITMFNTTSNYLVFMWPALMAVILQQVILLAMAISFSEEFKRESFIRDFAGKEKYSVLVMFIKCFPVWLFSNFNILIYYIFSKVFMIPGPENPEVFFATTALFILACTNLGVFFSILIPDALKATQILMIIASPAFIISGFTWPTYAMPEYIVYFTNIIPLTPYLEILKILLVEHGSDYLTIPFAKHLLILALVFFCLGWVALKIKIKKLFKEYHINEDGTEEESSLD